MSQQRPETPAPPAHRLQGLQLENGWLVRQIAKRNPNATGSCFSQGYVVENSDGRKGFLKALDYTAAFRHPNTAEILQAMTNAYVFEKTICTKCKHLSRVAQAIDSGAIQLDPADYSTKVEYLIFELADGDVRAHLDASEILDSVFILKTLHHVATGLKQLHQANIAHQDLKPSNVLVFKHAGSKICDLGRAWDRQFPAQRTLIDDMSLDTSSFENSAAAGLASIDADKPTFSETIGQH